MAHGESKRSDNYYVKVMGISKDSQDDIYLEVKKDGEAEKCSFIEGYIKSIENEKYEYEGKMKDAFKISIVDGENKYLFSSGFSSIGRKLINSLSSLESISSKVKISVWYKDKDGKRYNNIGIDHNGERVGWKYSREEQTKKIRKIKDADTGDFIKNDYSKLDDMFIKEISSINARIVQTKEQIDDELDTIFAGDDE